MDVLASDSTQTNVDGARKLSTNSQLLRDAVGKVLAVVVRHG